MQYLRPFFAILLCILSGVGGVSARLNAAETEPPLYLVLFRLNLDAEAKLKNLEEVKVIELLSGSKNDVPVKLPQAFIDDAWKQAAALDLKSAADRKAESNSTLTTFAHVPTPAGETAARISFGALDGAMNSTSNLRLLGRDGQMSSFGKNLGNAAFFLMYYALPGLPRETKAQRAALIEAEIQRNVANVQNAEVLSRKDLSEDTQSIVEITARSPRNKALTIRSRYLCNAQQMLAFVAITPDGMPAADMEAFERMFHAFRFRE